MDIECPYCGETWDADYLKFDLRSDAGLEHREISYRLTRQDKEELLRLGWQFVGRTTLSFIRCSSCEVNKPIPYADRREVLVREAVADFETNINDLETERAELFL